MSTSTTVTSTREGARRASFDHPVDPATTLADGSDAVTLHLPPAPHRDPGGQRVLPLSAIEACCPDAFGGVIGFSELDDLARLTQVSRALLSQCQKGQRHVQDRWIRSAIDEHARWRRSVNPFHGGDEAGHLREARAAWHSFSVSIHQVRKFRRRRAEAAARRASRITRWQAVADGVDAAFRRSPAAGVRYRAVFALLARLGKSADALTLMDGSFALDSDPAAMLMLRARYALWSGNTVEAILSATHFLDSAHGADARAVIVRAQLVRGDTGGAYDSLATEGRECIGLSAVIERRRGNHHVAWRLLQAYIAVRPLYHRRAEICALYGAPEMAIHWMNMAIDADEADAYGVLHSPVFDGVRNLDDWQEMLRRQNLLPAQLAGIEFWINPGSRAEDPSAAHIHPHSSSSPPAASP